MTQLTVNGRGGTVDMPPDTPLLWALRDHLGLTGTNFGCGIALQPRNVELQIESSVMYGLSHLLEERIDFKNGVVQQSNFHNDRVLRMNEAPKVTTRLIRTENYSGGIGEVGLPPLAPAVANAVAVLTGKRLRALPFDAESLKA